MEILHVITASALPKQRLSNLVIRAPGYESVNLDSNQDWQVVQGAPTVRLAWGQVDKIIDEKLRIPEEDLHLKSYISYGYP